MKRAAPDGIIRPGFEVEGAPSKHQKRRVRVYKPGEIRKVDVLREIPNYIWYGLISGDEVEIGEDNATRIRHIFFDVIHAPWFNQFQDDLSDVPPRNTIAQAAHCMQIELTVPEATIADIVNHVNDPYLGESWWVALTLSANQIQDQRNIEVIAYLPTLGSTDPSSIGLSADRSGVIYLQDISRIRPNSILRKLIRFATRDAAGN